MDSLNARHLHEECPQKEQEYMHALLNKCRDAQSSRTLKLAEKFKARHLHSFGRSQSNTATKRQLPIRLRPEISSAKA